MFANLVGPDALPSPNLLDDLRTLCASTESDLNTLAAVFANLPDEVTEDSANEALMSTIRSITAEPEKSLSLANVVRFIWDQWASLRLTKSAIVADLKSSTVTEEQLQNLSPLLDAIESKISIRQKHQAHASALKTGAPTINAAFCVVDARAIFTSSDHDDNLGDEQPYFEFDHFLPIATLEVVSEWNDRRSTHSYLLSEIKLNQLCDILGRAKKRLEIIKAKTSTR